MTRTATMSAEALVASLRAIADHSFDSIMITRAGKETPILYVNKAFTALTGYSAKSVIGKSPELLQGAATERAPLDALRRCMEKGKVFEGRAINYDSKRGPSSCIGAWYPSSWREESPRSTTSPFSAGSTPADIACCRRSRGSRRHRSRHHRPSDGLKMHSIGCSRLAAEPQPRSPNSISRVTPISDNRAS
jgi:PAS domain S-box-containing protein